MSSFVGTYPFFCDSFLICNVFININEYAYYLPIEPLGESNMSRHLFGTKFVALRRLSADICYFLRTPPYFFLCVSFIYIIFICAHE